MSGVFTMRGSTYSNIVISNRAGEKVAGPKKAGSRQ